MDHIRERLLAGVVKVNNEPTSIEESEERGREDLSGGNGERNAASPEEPRGDAQAYAPTVPAPKTSLEEELARREGANSEELEEVQCQIESLIERRAELRKELLAIRKTLELLRTTSTQQESASPAEEQGADIV